MFKNALEEPSFLAQCENWGSGYLFLFSCGSGSHWLHRWIRIPTKLCTGCRSRSNLMLDPIPCQDNISSDHGHRYYFILIHILYVASLTSIISIWNNSLYGAPSLEVMAPFMRTKYLQKAHGVCNFKHFVDIKVVKTLDLDFQMKKGSLISKEKYLVNFRFTVHK